MGQMCIISGAENLLRTKFEVQLVIFMACLVSGHEPSDVVSHDGSARESVEDPRWWCLRSARRSVYGALYVDEVIDFNCIRHSHVQLSQD